jgi:glycosyltransferase involved in cell wall biosynthesis
MAKKGIDAEKVTVIPHGTNVFEGTDDVPQLLPELWNAWGSEQTIFQPGFLFPYKGHKRMLGVVARLKEKYPKIHYVIQASENPRNQDEHNRLYGELFAEVCRLGLEENVTINRGFISQDALMAHIRTAKCVVLPYANSEDHDVRATSGIARLVLATETPLVVSRVHLFDDIEGLCPRVGDDEELYTAIDKIFYDWKEKAGQIAKRRAFLKKTSWASIAHRLSVYYKELAGR